MSTFNCKSCNYATNDKSNLLKHNKSKKHVEKEKELSNLSLFCPKVVVNLSLEENILKCPYCPNTYTNAPNLSRHKKHCSEKIELENKYTKIIEKKDDELEKNKNKYEQEILLLTEKIKYLEELTNKDAKLISNFQLENKNLRTLLNNAGSVVKSSVSTMSYIVRNYNEAPALEKPKDIAALHYDKTPTEFIEKIIREYRNNNMIPYIGNFILKTYKKEDPKKQSLWNSDTARLTYIIREIFNKNVDWRVDKKGIKTIEVIITPVLNYIADRLEEYCEKSEIGNRSQSTKTVVDKMMNLQNARSIIQLIEDKELEEDILRYMAPHLYLVKDGDLLEE